jgi:hypothetical protein
MRPPRFTFPFAIAVTYMNSEYANKQGTVASCRRLGFSRRARRASRRYARCAAPSAAWTRLARGAWLAITAGGCS